MSTIYTDVKMLILEAGEETEIEILRPLSPTAHQPTTKIGNDKEILCRLEMMQALAWEEEGGAREGAETTPLRASTHTSRDTAT
jgi:hypothetical protein